MVNICCRSVQGERNCNYVKNLCNIVLREIYSFLDYITKRLLKDNVQNGGQSPSVQDNVY